jgi:hypothetical protein
MTYNIRTKEGDLVAKITNSLASKILDGVKGEFKSCLFKTENSADPSATYRSNVFELAEDRVWVLGAGEEIKLFLWVGYRLSKAD